MVNEKSVVKAENHYDAVIIGSGFGGSVMAYRLAERGLKVCVLERGKKYPPGSFPRSPDKMKKNFWDPSEGLYGMFDVWSFRDIAAVVSSGLGGGSLIYANVLIRKDEKWFVKEDLAADGHEYWPVNRAELDPHYDRAEQMLNAQKYPFDKSPYKETRKTQALQFAAQELNLDWHLPNLAVTFANPNQEPITGEPIAEKHRNLHDRTRYTCRLCGECDIGCNYGSKNTLDYNYLSEAQRLGAEIKTLCEVRSFRPQANKGYVIEYVEHNADREGQVTKTDQLPPHTITANQLILAAGSIGSTYLLLKNQQAHFPQLSPKLGTRFCGNGDLINFAIKGDRVIDGSYGPVITSTIRMPDALDGGTGRGFYIQDAGYPDFINWILEMSEAPGNIRRKIPFILRWLWVSITKRGLQDSNLSEEISELLFGTNKLDLSSTTMPLLGMGRDIPSGVMKLRDGDRLDITPNFKPSQDYFDRLRKTMENIAQKLSATYIDNPLWYLKRTIAAHPLGGCPMGRHQDEGVVDSYGEVFNYPGFFIADGSVMPGPVGPNPSLTIAALSDRFAEKVIENYEKNKV
ncbi:choline dehydrogenase-like flavoprotein [Xenococcus sp. PCC 7305]|uniref:GMC oxidoreductase n=1 Tax=Xenococcus sp. PCC 7305 TaxID=102125 RepID=UPI0002ABB1B8|nr:GMC family oxidoreductase [Xenococcus sp. PCC 7305]ELS02366.1 choline dehydrogenase-like flavoprotein [Xenococcus sp. PCC 7305]